MKLQFDWPVVLQVSHSRIKSWRRCEMQHHYRYVQKLRKVKPPTAMFIGSGVHSILEAQAKRGKWEPELAQFRSDFDKMFREEREELGDLPAEIERIMKGYFEHYRNDGLLYVPRHRNARTEIPIKVDLDARTRWLGYIDRFPQDNEGRNWIMDHKTCRAIPDEDTRYSDLQLLFYCWLVPHLGYPKPDGVIWDYIRKKAPAIPEVLVKGGISKAAKIDTTYAVYMATVYEKLGVDALPQYEEFAATLKGREERFYRRIYLPSPSPTMVNNVVNDTLMTIEDIRARGATAQVRNMGRDCKSCSYYQLCSAEVRGLDSDYIRKTEYTMKEKTDASEEKAVGPSDEE